VAGGAVLLKRTLVFAGILLLLTGAAFASPPPIINFQGRLTTLAGTPETGIKNITFKLYGSESGTDIKWTESDVSCSLDAIGAFSTILGPLNIDFSQPLWMEVFYNGSPFAPRQQLASVPYAFYAITAESVLGGGGGITQEVDTLDSVLSRENISTFDAQVGNLTVEGNLKVTGTIEGGSPVKIAGGLMMMDGILLVGTSSIDALSGMIYGNGSRLTGLPLSGGISTAEANTRYLRMHSGWQNANLSIAGNLTVGSYFKTEGNITVTCELGANGGDPSGANSVALGKGTVASSNCATAMGYFTTASGQYSTAMGNLTISSGFASGAMGSTTEASGDYSIAMGVGTLATGEASTAMGHYTTAVGNYSTSMGNGTSAVGTASTAMGGTTEAIGDSSTTMGMYTSAEGQASIAMGIGTNSRPFASFVMGRYNIISGSPNTWEGSEPVFVIGNGADDSNRSNALTVLKNGNLGIATSEPGAARLYVVGSAEITGDLNVVGNVSKGGGSFLIDHPLDPKDKVLRHSFVESPEMRNIYEGLAVLDNSGNAVVKLPKYFEALNDDYKYHLTCVGGYSPVYVKEGIKDNKFVIAGGKPGLKVSWMVTGTRHDAYAMRHPLIVEEEKN